MNQEEIFRKKKCFSHPAEAKRSAHHKTLLTVAGRQICSRSILTISGIHGGSAEERPLSVLGVLPTIPGGLVPGPPG